MRRNVLQAGTGVRYRSGCLKKRRYSDHKSPSGKSVRASYVVGSQRPLVPIIVTQPTFRTGSNHEEEFNIEYIKYLEFLVRPHGVFIDGSLIAPLTIVKVLKTVDL